MPELSTLELMESVRKRSAEEVTEADQQQENRRQELEELLARVDSNTKQLIDFFQTFEQKVEVTNPSTFELPKTVDVTAGDVVEAIDKLSDKIEEPDYTEVIEAIEKWGEQNAELMQKIEKIDFKPEIKVAAPKVTVPAPDLKGIEKAIKDAKPEPVDLSDLSKKLDNQTKMLKKVETALSNFKIKIPNTPTDPLIMYVPAEMDEVGDTKYYGHIMSNGMWYIRKKQPNGDGTFSFRMAFGNSNFATNWTNRATLTNYNYWSA